MQETQVIVSAIILGGSYYLVRSFDLLGCHRVESVLAYSCPGLYWIDVLPASLNFAWLTMWVSSYLPGSFPIDRGYPWVDVNGEEVTQTTNDGCLLCQVDSNILGGG